MDTEIEFTQQDIDINIIITNKYQWVYKTEYSPLWNITPMYLTKDQFYEFAIETNKLCKFNHIVEFKKVKVSKMQVE